MGSACCSSPGGGSAGNVLGSGGSVWQQVFQLCGSHVACIGPVCLPHFIPAVGTIRSELSVSPVERSDKR